MLDHDIWRDIEIELSDVGPMFHPEVYGEGSIFEMAKKFWRLHHQNSILLVFQWVALLQERFIGLRNSA